MTFSYCSFTPREAVVAAPPVIAWPTAGVGTNVTTNSGSAAYAPYMIDGNSGYQFGLDVGGSRVVDPVVMIDHCDMWGWGNAIIVGLKAQKTIQHCWIHDSANPDAQAYHTDGIGFLSGGSDNPHNLTIYHCTIASIGNTNGIALQAASAPYSNVTVDSCYLAGFGYTVDMGVNAGNNTNMTFTNNVFATDLQPAWGLVYGDPSPLYGAGSTNVWKNNKLGDQFVWPDGGTLHATDWLA
jgi:hypothetical protein